MVLGEGKKGCSPAAPAAAVVLPLLEGMGAQLWGSRRGLQNSVTTLKFWGLRWQHCSRSRGFSSDQNQRKMPSAATWPGAGLFFVGGLVMPPLLPPPAPPHHQGRAQLRARGRRSAVIPELPAFLCWLGLLTVCEAKTSCAGHQPPPVPVQEGKECQARVGDIRLPPG